MDNNEDKSDARAILGKLQAQMKIDARLIKSGLLGLDPETGTLYYEHPTLHAALPISLGKDTRFYRIAELMVTKEGIPLSYKEIYEHIFSKDFESDVAKEPQREIQFIFSQFKQRLKKHGVDTTMLKKLFSNSHNSGYKFICR